MTTAAAEERQQGTSHAASSEFKMDIEADDGKGEENVEIERVLRKRQSSSSLFPSDR